MSRRRQSWRQFVARFQARLERRVSGCLEWTGARSRGYGNVEFDGKTLRSNRVAWRIATGRWPTKHVLHSCDNRACCEPSHLFSGTQKDNIDDMWSKGRGSKPPHHVGAAHPHAKLTERQARDIKRRRLSGEPVKALAREYGVVFQLISQIARGDAWRHVEV